MSTRVMYPAEIKEKAIKMKLAGKSTKEIMRTLNIKNPTQVTKKKNLVALVSK
ncbi:hypothetical protein I612_14771 [Listeria monocytogenes SHL004]|nr:hypothetical protein [Listeria monocytogenes]KHK04811.1 hypothetical protein I612_14771 [Listeria monocytogenes SHL004]